MAEKKVQAQKSSLKSKKKSVSDPAVASRNIPSSPQSARTMEELLAKTGYHLKGLKKGDVVTGAITSVSGKEVTIDVGAKTDAVVIDRELENYRDALLALKVGEQVVAQVIVPENDRGQPVLSLRRTLFEKSWQDLADAQKKGIAVEVVLKELVRGGILVDYAGLRGYIPQSQLDQNLSKQLDRASGRRIQAKVVEVDKETNRLVFSQRAVVEEEFLTKQRDLMEHIEIGRTVEATITGVVPFGAFAKFSITAGEATHEVEGLIHISEIAWEKVENPNEYLKSGDKVKVKIVGADPATGKLTLSLKQLLPDPWERVTDMFPKDSQVKGTVTRVTPYGVFVNVSPGIEGLIHISKIAPGEEPKEGSEITCIVEDVQQEKRKISLSMTLTEKPIGYR